MIRVLFGTEHFYQQPEVLFTGSGPFMIYKYVNDLSMKDVFK